MSSGGHGQKEYFITKKQQPLTTENVGGWLAGWMAGWPAESGSRRHRHRLEHMASVSRKLAPQPHHRCCCNRRHATSTQEKSTATIKSKLQLNPQV